MRKPKKEIQLTSYDELLGINEAEQNTLNQIVEVPLNELHSFRNHPFHVNDDEKMAETVESIKNYGILNPALVRPRAEGGYELIAGHRRNVVANWLEKVKCQYSYGTIPMMKP